MQNKPWVPACHDCNSGATKDDEYMQRLAMLWGADGSKDALDVEERFFKTRQREEAKGLQADVRASLVPVNAEELLFPGGINMALRGERLCRIADKLVRGWWYKLSNGLLGHGRSTGQCRPSLSALSTAFHVSRQRPPQGCRCTSATARSRHRAAGSTS
jgi:hypothetical protein